MLCCLPISSSLSLMPSQTLTPNGFSRDPVAKSWSSCDQEMPQIILEWASFSFLISLKLRDRSSSRLNMAHCLSRPHERRYWSLWENSNATTVLWWALSRHDGTVVWFLLRSHMIMSAYFASSALQALAATSPLLVLVTQNTSKTWP